MTDGGCGGNKTDFGWKTSWKEVTWEFNMFVED